MLISRLRGRITERIPVEILHLICEASEDVASVVGPCEEREDLDETLATFGHLLPNEEARTPLGLLWEAYSAFPTVALRIFSKNRTLWAMSHVCRTWRARLTHSKGLWRDIAFDVTEPGSIRLARDFLDMVKDSTVPLRIYAGLGRSVDPNVSRLLQDLRTCTDRWEVFEYQGRLKYYRQYLDLEARRLRSFSDRHDFSSAITPQYIFAGQAPALRSLSTSTIGDWTPATLSNLTELNISYRQRGAAFSLKSLVDVLRATPNLEALRLASPKPLTLDCAADEVVDLPRLELLRFNNTNIYALFAHLRLPGVRSMMFSSSYDRWSQVDPHPAFDAPNVFSPLPHIAFLEQTFSSVEIRIGSLHNGALHFSIRLSTDDGCFFGINLTLVGESWCRWESYFKRSIMELTERIRLSPGSCLQFSSDISLNCRPLLGFHAIGVLIFDGHGRDILQTLACSSHGAPPTMLFPHLEELILSDDQMNQYELPLISMCLGLREGLSIIVSDANLLLLEVVGDVCVIERKSTSLDIRVLLTDTPHSLSKFGRSPTRSPSS
jgi:hypothetical protein